MVLRAALAYLFSRHQRNHTRVYYLNLELAINTTGLAGPPTPESV